MIDLNSRFRLISKNHCNRNRKFPRILPVSPGLLVMVLVSAALFLVAVNPASAASSKQIPYKDSYVLQFVSQAGSDQVYTGVGTNTVGGSFTIVVQVHLEASYYDPVSNSSVTPFSGSETITVANGDTLLLNFTGSEVVPLPPSPPFAVGGSQTISGGTGRFAGATGSLTFTGLDFNNGTITISTTGTISTVGSNKTGS